MPRIQGIIAAGGALALAAVGGVAGPALAAPATATNWHVGVYTPSGRTLSQAEASAAADGLAQFQFTTAPNTALLIDTQGSQTGLLGNIAGKTVTASFTVASNTSPFSYWGEGTTSNPCGGSANVRLFFETSTAGGFDPAQYWWSNPVGAQQLDAGTFTVSASVSVNSWTDYNGQNPSPGFAAAAANVTGIGLSFGGGCFFENGVGAPNATFTLNSFTVS